MSKKKFHRYITEMRKFFSEDESVATLLDQLHSQVEALSDVSAPKKELLIAEEVKDKPFHYALYSDGACRGNPGPGAWASLGQNDKGETIFESNGLEILTTNNRMELEGAIVALKEMMNHLTSNELKANDSRVTVYIFSDSKYVIEGITKWVVGWKQNGWKKADKKEPENLDLWKDFDHVKNQFTNLHFQWVKGHAGHPQNERCDELCNMALDEAGY
ncbi:MAG: ribonuclease H family protein [Bacteriovoracaceae bacterium]